ncbi:MAG: PrsW family intramembrane metalloprotease, partial [Leptospiraceae bacterium]|nr:PrsW family intramembrane metalloprotease [Leptospiraceae bacterium]
MKWLTDLLLSIENIDPGILFLSFLSIVFWGFILYKFHPEENGKKIKIIIIAMFLGFVSTRIILSLHPILWPEVNFKPKKTSLLTQTAYIAFIQAGAMEETFKILLIMIQGFIMSFSWKHKKWDKNIVLVGAFVALGFSFVENYIYINKDHKNSISLIATFIGRTIYSSNIHMLINICFSLFLLKTNYKDSLGEKLRLIIYAFFLAIFQHGVVDF